MSNLIITPDLASIVRRVDTKIQYIYTSAWQRRSGEGIWWNRIAKARSSSTLQESLLWLLETAKIRSAGDDGGVIDFDDLVEIAHSARNEDWQNGLALTRNQIEDALGGSVVSGSPLDRAARWAQHAGAGGAYWPQKQVAYGMKNGKTLTAYDGGAFFRKGHPVNPSLTGGSTYDNLFTGYPLTASNLARITAYIRGIKAPDGEPRHLRPRIVAAGPDLEFTVGQLLGADFYTDPKNALAGAAGSNIIKTRYGFTEPIIAPELDEVGVWYLGCELVEDDELAGIIYQEREPFWINSFTNVSDAELSRANKFEWHQRGRNTTFFGHPFLLFRIESSGAEDPALPPL